MNFGRTANINIFRKIRQFETLIKPGGLLVRNYNPLQFPKSTSGLATLSRSVVSNTSNYPKYGVLSKLPMQSMVSVMQTRTASTHGNHVRLWVVERMMSISLVSIIPAALVLNNQWADICLAFTVVTHAHWGLAAIILDYVRPIIVGPVIPKVAMILLNILSGLTLGGLMLLIFNGPGLSKVIIDGWAIGKNKEKSKVN